MNAPLYVAPQQLRPQPVDPHAAAAEVADLLRQLVDTQREQVALLKAQAASQDNLARWRSLLGRWNGEFPGIGAACKTILPVLERAYLTMVNDVTDKLQGDDAENLEDDFVLSEFLDRYGIRLGQLGNILSQLGPLAEASGDSGVRG